MLWYFTRGKKRKKKSTKFQMDVRRQIFTLLYYGDYFSERAQNSESLVQWKYRVSTCRLG